MTGGAARGDEGQWPPDRLDRLDWTDLQRRGLKLDAGEIWNPGGEALAMAVVRLGGCSASFISDAGLILTNHHCAYRAIQQNSTPADDILGDGFVAHHWSEEKVATGYRAEVLRSMTDVTERVLGAVSSDAGDRARYLAIQRAIKDVVRACEERPVTRCRVGQEFGGLRYVLFDSLEIKDIRLVYAPPVAVGEFGGEVDNWMWPRHTGDFSLMRAYVAPDGSSVLPDPENVPYRPPRHLKISTRGVRPGDLVMLMGYPGRTSRYLPAAAIEARIEFLYPRREASYAAWIDLLEDAGARGDEARLAVAGTIKGLANRLKNTRGMQIGLRRLRLLEAKRAAEAELARWMAADADRQAEFGHILADLDALYRGDEAVREKEFILGTLERASRTLGFARTLLENARERDKPDLERRPGYQERDQERLWLRLERAQRDLDVPADRAVTAHFLRRALELPAGQRIAELDARIGVLDPGATGEARDAVERFVEVLYAGARLAELAERRRLFQADRTELDRSDDTMLVLARALEPAYDRMRERNESRAGGLSRVLPLYARLLQRRRGRVYPDASGTLRVSVATVKGYAPRDAIWMDPQTTLSGLLDKETGSDPFSSPARVLAAARDLDPGRWRQPGLDDVPLCFLSDADTTGGNSGSPVMNGRGELVGVNFDRVFENIAGDYGYSPDRSRNISVDSRYLLWMLERVEKAWPILREIGVEPSPPRPRKQDEAGRGIHSSGPGRSQ